MPVTPNSIVTPQSINTGTCVVTAANTTYTDSPTNDALLFTAGANGARITKITSIARSTVGTASKLQIYRSSDGGTTKRWCLTALMNTYTQAATTSQTPTDFGLTDLNPLLLAPNERLYAASSQANSDGIVFNAEGSNY